MSGWLTGANVQQAPGAALVQKTPVAAADVEDRDRIEAAFVRAQGDFFAQLTRSVKLEGNDLLRPNLAIALKLPSFMAAVNLLAHEIALLPVRVHRMDGASKVPVDDVTSRRLAHQWTPWETAYSAVKRFATYIFAHGRAYALVNRLPTGALRSLDVLDPNTVTRVVEGDDVGYLVNGMMGQQTVLRADMIEVFWRARDVPYPSLSSINDNEPWDRPYVVGWQAIRAGLLALLFSAQYFGSGMLPAVAFIPESSRTMEDIQQFTKDLRLAVKMMRRHGENFFTMLPGTEVKPISASPRDSQLMELRRMSVEEIGRLFGIPPHMLGAMDKATYNNLAQADVSLAKHAIAPWAVAIGQELTRAVYGPRSQFYVELDMHSLMRGTFGERTDALTRLVSQSILTPNEARIDLGWPAIEGGDERLLQPGAQNMQSEPVLEAMDDEVAQMEEDDEDEDMTEEMENGDE